MKSHVRLSLLLLLPVSMVLGPLAWTAAMRVPTNPVIATVDLQRVVEGLDERAVKEGDLKARIDELQKRLEDLAKQLRTARDNYDLLPDGPEKRAEADKLRKLAYQVRFEQQWSEQMVEEFRADLLRQIYNKIDDASARLARQNAYTLVLASDEAIAIPEGSGLSEVMRTISLKRMLYVDPAHDVTADLITMMNNEFNANRRGR